MYSRMWLSAVLFPALRCFRVLYSMFEFGTRRATFSSLRVQERERKKTVRMGRVRLLIRGFAFDNHNDNCCIRICDVGISDEYRCSSYFQTPLCHLEGGRGRAAFLIKHIALGWVHMRATARAWIRKANGVVKTRFAKGFNHHEKSNEITIHSGAIQEGLACTLGAECTWVGGPGPSQKKLASPWPIKTWLTYLGHSHSGRGPVCRAGWCVMAQGSGL